MSTTLDQSLTTLPMDSPFSQATREQWVELAVAGLADDQTPQAALESMRHTTLDGIAMNVLYDSTEHCLAPNRARNMAHGSMRNKNSWDNRFSTHCADPAIAQQQIIRALAGGVTSIELWIDESWADKSSADGIAGIQYRSAGGTTGTGRH